MRRLDAILGAFFAASLLGCAHRPPQSPANGSLALPFIENDFSLAMNRARAADLPVFVEVWAPW